MNKKVLFIWNYFYFPWEKGKSRFSDLASAIVKAGHELEVVCSSFYHMGKSQRIVAKARLAELPYKVHFIQEPGYGKNVSIRRIRSIHVFNAGVRKYLSKHETADLVYVPVPSCKTALIARKWCDKVGAKLIIDIEDLWPESFEMVIRPKWACRLITLPLCWKANRCYRLCDGVVAVSKTFLERGLRVRKDVPPNCASPIGSDFEYVDGLKNSFVSRKPQGEFWVAYIGTLGSSYDLKMVMDGCQSAYDKGHKELCLHIFGSGPDEDTLKAYSRELQVPVAFHGLLSYEEMMTWLFDADLGVNPIVKGSVASLINKVGDYAAAGVPVLNSQDCKEYVDLLTKFNAGISVPPSDGSAFAKKLIEILNGAVDIRTMKDGALRLGSSALSRSASQAKILSMIDILLP